MPVNSIEAAPPPSREQEEAAIPSLSPEADPNGLTERAPAIASLLPDEALSLALAGGDAHAVHAALTARLNREPSGPARDTLRQVLAQRELFAVSESPPRLGAILGTGISLVQLPEPARQQAPFIATRALRVLGVSLWPLGQHLVRRGRDGQLEVLGRVPSATGLGAMRAMALVAAGAVLFTGLSAGLLPRLSHEVTVVNGLSRPVEVRLDDRTLTLEPGAVSHEQVFSLAGVRTVEARWPGEATSFESLRLEDNEPALYNILGAASVQVDGTGEPGGTRPLVGALGKLQSGEQLVSWKSGWERTVREHADAGRWEAAANVAEAVALADPTALRAREEALRWTLRYKRDQATAFLSRLIARYPDDVSAHQLVQDTFLSQGWSSQSRTRYEKLAAASPSSALHAFLAARSLPYDLHFPAYGKLLVRFPDSTEARLELARLYLEAGNLERTLELLGEAPSTLQGVELRVRALISSKRLRDASKTVRVFAADPRNHSWELAVLAGRLDRLAGPTRAQYITHDLIPAALKGSREHMLAFALLTGDSLVKDPELQAVMDPSAREALAITREITRDLTKATERARTAPDSVLSRMPLEAAAVLALEFSRTGATQEADRAFGSHLALLLAREPLEHYVRTGTELPRMGLVSPGLHATAHLIRLRGLDASTAQEERDEARLADVLGGFARRTLDPGYTEYEPPVRFRARPRGCYISIIRGSGDEP